MRKLLLLGLLPVLATAQEPIINLAPVGAFPGQSIEATRNGWQTKWPAVGNDGYLQFADHGTNRGMGTLIVNPNTGVLTSGGFVTAGDVNISGVFIGDGSGLNTLNLRVSTNGTVVGTEVTNWMFWAGTNVVLEATNRNGLVDVRINAAGGSGSPGGANTQVQINDGGVFGGDPGFFYNKTTDALTVNGNIGGNADITCVGNMAPDGLFIGDGSQITALNASELTSGTISEERLHYAGTDPAAGLVLTSTSSNTPAWLAPGEGASDGRGWDTNGNSGLTAANVLGTLDNVNLKLVASNSVMANLSGYSNTIVLGNLSEIIGWQPYSVIGGGRSNLITGATNSANWFRLGYNTIAGGGSNTITSEVSGGNTIGGGLLNSIVGDPDDASVVAGGKLNNATGETATIGGGYNNDIGTAAAFGTIGGGIDNLIVGSSAAPRTNDYATISGGHSNRASGAYAVIPGGNQNLASGSNSIAMGFKASATHPGAVVISADVSATTGQASPANNSFTVNATGGINLLGSSITGNGAGLTNLNQFAFTTNRYSFHPGNTGNGGANAVTDSTPDETGNSIWYAATNGSNPRIHAWYLAAGANRFVWGFVPNERTLGRTNCAITARFMTTNESYFGYSLTANVMDRQSVSNSLVSGNGFVSNDGTTLSVIRAGTNIISVSRVFAVKPNLTNAVWEFAIGVGATVNSTNSVFFIDADADFY